MIRYNFVTKSVIQKTDLPVAEQRSGKRNLLSFMEVTMIRLRILDILNEQNRTKYWLFKRMDMLSYRNFQNIVNNKTKGIRFETLNKLTCILNVPVGELFEQTGEEDSGQNND